MGITADLDAVSRATPPNRTPPPAGHGHPSPLIAPTDPAARPRARQTDRPSPGPSRPPMPSRPRRAGRSPARARPRRRTSPAPGRTRPGSRTTRRRRHGPAWQGSKVGFKLTLSSLIQIKWAIHDTYTTESLLNSKQSCSLTKLRNSANRHALATEPDNVSSTGTISDRIPSSPSGIPAPFVRACGKPRFYRSRHGESPQITPSAGVVGMRLRSVVLESFMAQRPRTKAGALVGHCIGSVDSTRPENQP
jgi:hypothetical protein